MALVPLRTKQRGPAPRMPDGQVDIIDESINFFRANVFFRNYEIKSPADRTLIYITLYIQECLKRIQQKAPSTKEAAHKEMYALAVAPFDYPGCPGFPLNNMYGKPADRNEEDQTKGFMSQIRHEVGARIVERIWDANTDKPSKWWMCFTKRRFMEKSLSGR
jgi:actin related protein 2/3 complex subunit 3